MSLYDQERMKSVEEFVLVWLGNIEDNSDTIAQLRHYVDDIRTFKHSNECMDFITEFPQEQKLILIVSLDDVISYDIFILTAEAFTQVFIIYVLCKENSVSEEFEHILHNHHTKVQGPFTEMESLKNHLDRATAHHLSNKLISFQTINMTLTETTTRVTSDKLNKQEASFMYAQMVKEIVMEFELTPSSKMEMIQFCRELYNGNSFELAFIDDLQFNPRNQSALSFYTAEHFLYRMLNRALRLQEINKLYHLRYFIRQLNEELKQLHREKLQQEESITFLYRGQGMQQEELQKLRHSVGGLLSFNAFLSTSIDYAVAYMYAETMLSATDIFAVFIQIDVQPTNLCKNIFADIGHLTRYKDEKEYLFSMGSIFRILSVEQETNGIYHVKLVLTSDQDEQLAHLKWFMNTTLNLTHRRGPLFRLAGLMEEMSEHTYAEYFYQLLLKDETIENQPCALASVHGNMGYLCKEKGDIREALNHYELALKLYEENSSHDNDQTVATILSNIGGIFITQGKFDQAVTNLERALAIDMHPSNGKIPNPAYISNRYNELGVICERTGQYENALNYYKQCLQIRLQNMPPNHPNLLAPYNNIALLYDKLGQSEQAIHIYMRIIEISTNSLPPNHLTFATLYHNLACNLEDIGRLDEALNYAQKAFDIVDKSSLPSTHEIVLGNRQHMEHLQRILSNSDSQNF
jgi:tetratricopeptide (TPR) repeat protein